MTDDYSNTVTSESQITESGDQRDGRVGSGIASNSLTSAIEAPDYLENFNIDTGNESGEPNVPHYIVNLNSDMNAMSTLPVNTSPGVGESSTSLQTSNADSTINDNVSFMCGINSTGRSQQFFIPAMRSKTRGRGRFSSVPLDDV
ncbi:unnamed protein product [Trichobilharzia regenti]|nr:unnamed protein product [Trichobilharzia regenti]